MTPILSVITTVYNCQKYVEASIRSVLEQDFTDFEFIIVNDGSTDGTWDVVKNIQDKRIVLIDNDTNAKIPTRRNQAIQAAKGRYIAIHDGDDLSFPNRFSRQVELLDHDDSVFCCGGHAEKIDESGTSVGIMSYPPSTHKEIMRKFLGGINPIIDPSTMMRIADFRDLGGYSCDTDIYTVPDYDLWCRAIISGRCFRNLQMPLIRYRVNPNGMTQKHKIEMITAHRKVQTRFLAERYGKRKSTL